MSPDPQRENSPEAPVSFENLRPDTSTMSGLLAHYITGHVEHAFLSLGNTETDITDYMSNFLVRATLPELLVDAHKQYCLDPVRAPNNPFEVYQSMVPVLEGRALRGLLKEMGDAALFYLAKKSLPPWCQTTENLNDVKLELSNTGQQALRDATAVSLSQLDALTFEAENATLLKIADLFEMCAYGIGLANDSVEEEAAYNRKHGMPLVFR